MKNSTDNISKKIENELIKKIDTLLKNKDVIVISDYNKGLITKSYEYIINKGNLLKFL